MDQVDAIILDLRSNGGGLLEPGGRRGQHLHPRRGVIVSTEGLHSPKQVYKATGDAYPNIPLYVLTDPYTASASEIVAGALQDYDRATLVGETTFGKGLVQSIEPLSNGGALKATTAVYLTPKGRDINKKGIVPDVVAPDDPATTGVDETVQAALKLITGAATLPATTSTTTTSTAPVSTTVPSTTPLTLPGMSGFRPRFFAPVSSGPADRSPDAGSAADPGRRGFSPRPAGAAAAAGGRVRGGGGGRRLRGHGPRPAPAGGRQGGAVAAGRRGSKGRRRAPSYRVQVVALVQAVARPAAMDWSIEKSTEAGASLILLVQAAGSPRSVRQGRPKDARRAGPGSPGRRPSRASSRRCPRWRWRRRSPPRWSGSARSASLPSFSIREPDRVCTTWRAASRRPRRRRTEGVAVATGALRRGSGPLGGPRGRLDRRGAGEPCCGAGMTPARLGRGVLRTETAGPVAVAVARLALGDW